MNTKGTKKYNQALIILSSLFFIWGLITVLNFMMVDTFMIIFSLTLSQSYSLNLAFFGAYLLVSYPAGLLIDRIGYSTGMVTGVLVGALGCFLFCPAAAYQSYGLLLISLFVLGSGVSVLQVCANPYVALLGPRGLGASKLTLVQAFNALGTFLAPLLAAGLFMEIAGISHENLYYLSPQEYKEALIGYVQMPYLLMGIAFVLLSLLIGFSELPVLDTNKFLPLPVGDAANRKTVMQVPHVAFGAIAIFFYVGAEVAISQYLIKGAAADESLTLFVRVFWGTAMVGRFVGFFLLKVISPRNGMALFSASAVLLLIVFMVSGESSVGFWALSLMGLSNSILFPCIYTMGIDGMGREVESASAYMNMAIVGGAILPFFFAFISGTLVFLLPLFSYAFIIFYGLKGSRYTKRTNFY